MNSVRKWEMPNMVTKGDSQILVPVGEYLDAVQEIHRQRDKLQRAARLVNELKTQLVLQTAQSMGILVRMGEDNQSRRWLQQIHSKILTHKPGSPIPLCLKDDFS